MRPFSRAGAVLTTTIVFLAVGCGQGGEDLKAKWARWQKYARTYEGSDLFPPLRYPRGNDWLACHEEAGQTFEAYVKSRPVKLTRTRRRIVIQPVGTFTDEQKEMLEAMREYVAVCFQCRADRLDPVPLPEKGFRKRPTGPQYLTGRIVDGVLLPGLPDDAAVSIGITCADIYPGPGWNFVFGEARLRDRVAIQSLARYYPSFWGERPGDDETTIVLRRALATLAHEIGHAFSMQHCVYFQCNMNGSNSLAESDRRHLHLCPVCLRKLAWNRGFDIRERYRKLRAFYKKHGLEREADWVARRLKEIDREE